MQIAREYGFASWRDLKAFVERRDGPAEPFRNLIGFYRHDPRLVTNAVVQIGVESGRLFIERGGSRFGLSDCGQGRVAIAGVEGHYTFEGSEDGPATALVSHTRAGEARLERIGAAEARAIHAARDRDRAEQILPRAAVVVPPALLQRCAGHYDDERAVAAILHQNGLHQRLERVSPEATERAAARIRDRLAEQERPRSLAAIDPNVLQRYAGRYRVDAGQALTVSAEGGRLFVDIPGQRRYEVHPESEQMFFWTVVAAQISFVTDSAGRLTHAVLHQHGLDIPLTRMDDEGVAI